MAFHQADRKILAIPPRGSLPRHHGPCRRITQSTLFAGLKQKSCLAAWSEGEKIVLEKRYASGIVPPLPDDPQRIQPSKTAVLPKPGQDRSLVDAADDFRRVLHPNGKVDGQEDDLDQSKQFQIIESEARWHEIVSLMVGDQGFIKLRHNFGIGYEDSYGFIRDDVGVFNMRQANLFVTDSGLVIAIDSIPVRLSGLNRRAFGE